MPIGPKVISPTDPAARYTPGANNAAMYAYSDYYVIDLKHVWGWNVRCPSSAPKSGPAEIPGGFNGSPQHTLRTFQPASERAMSFSVFG